MSLAESTPSTPAEPMTGHSRRLAKLPRMVDNEQFSQLFTVARDARIHAYAPYSDFTTGAAVLCEDGSIHRGVLVENLVFGVAMCAERVALFSAVSAGAGTPQALALVAPKTAGTVTYPCGPCLQVAIELGGPDMLIAASSPDSEEYETKTIDELAPGIPRRKQRRSAE